MHIDHRTLYKFDLIHASCQDIRHYPYHWHPGVEIIYVERGSVTVEVHKEPELLSVVCLHEGEIHIISHNEIHSIKGDGEGNKVIMLYIEQDRISRIFKNADALEFDYVSNIIDDVEEKQCERLKLYVKNFYHDIIDGNAERDVHFKKNFDEFLQWLVETYETVNRKLRRGNKSRKYYERILGITEYIIENVSDKNILTSLANREYLNSDYISHELKDKLGYNFQELVNFYRVEKAIRMLLDTEMNVTEIAFECGFSATRYMYKEFRKFYLEGPVQFRKIYKNAQPDVDYISNQENVKIQIDELRALKVLYDEGVITLEEFKAVKKRLLQI